MHTCLFSWFLSNMRHSEFIPQLRLKISPQFQKATPYKATIMFLLALLALILCPWLCEALSPNCTSDSAPCGTSLTCCALSGYSCNFNRGIPYCENEEENVVSLFTGPPCVDPYLYDCSGTGVSGCCPIGTVCFHGDMHTAPLSCIDVYGTYTSPYLSTTQGIDPPETYSASNEPAVVYSPPASWTTSNTAPNCTSNPFIHVTSTINSTVSFDYTGPSVRVHTVTSPYGGIFSVFVDGFNTSSTIDTFSSNDSSLPLCYPVQFPPFVHPPPDLAARNDHTITLVYMGPSPSAPNNTYLSEGRFDSFAIPQPLSSVATNGCSGKMEGIKIALFASAVAMVAVHATFVA